MSPGASVSAFEMRHALNNLFAKIMGAADLALAEPCGPPVRSELEIIIGLAAEGAALVARLKAVGPGA